MVFSLKGKRVSVPMERAQETPSKNFVREQRVWYDCISVKTKQNIFEYMHANAEKIEQLRHTIRY